MTASGELTTGRTDFGPFFGFGARDVDPRSAQLVLQQPLFAGGSLKAGVAQAEAGQEAARQQAARARLELQAKVAEAYGAVLTAQEAFELNRRQVESLTEAARQADLRFTSGDAPRSDQAQAEAQGELAHEVGAEDHAAGEDGDEGDLDVGALVGGVVGDDLGGEFADAGGDLVSGDEDAVDVGEHEGDGSVGGGSCELRERND